MKLLWLAIKAFAYLICIGLSGVIGALGTSALARFACQFLVEYGVVSMEPRLISMTAFAAGVILGFGPFAWMAMEALRRFVKNEDSAVEATKKLF